MQIFDKSADIQLFIQTWLWFCRSFGNLNTDNNSLKPRIFRLEKDQALINRLGFNNHGSEIVSRRISANLTSGFLGINIGPNKDTK